MKKISFIILALFLYQAQAQYKVNTKVQNKANTKAVKTSTKTGVLTATSKHRMKALPKAQKKQKKLLESKATKDFQNKVAANYKPKAGKLHRTVSAQRPYFNDAYIEYQVGKYEPYKKTIEFGSPSIWEDLFVKFKVKQGKSYLLRLRFKVEDYEVEGTNNVARGRLYASLGESWSIQEIAMRNSRLVPADYTFDVIINSTTNGWIQVPYTAGVDRGDWNSVVPWKFKSVTVSEL